MRKFNCINAGTTRVAVMLLMILSTLFITSCLARRFTSKELDGSGKQLNPPADKSYIYVMRPGGFIGSGAHMSVALDGKFAAFIQPKTYILLEVLPKKHKIKLGQKGDHNHFANARIIDLETLPGRTYFVHGNSASYNPKIKILSNDVGRKLIIEGSYKRVISLFDK